MSASKAWTKKNELAAVGYSLITHAEWKQEKITDVKVDADMAPLIDSEVLLAFSTYATIVILKMMLMAPLTAYFRFARGAFLNKEDVKHAKNAEEGKKMLCVDPDVERVRRAHQNDLENIVPFVVIGLLYALTGPDLATAVLHFRVFTASRICHTVSYVLALPQPSRALSWMAGMVITFSMAYRVLSTGIYANFFKIF